MKECDGMTLLGASWILWAFPLKKRVDKLSRETKKRKEAVGDARLFESVYVFFCVFFFKKTLFFCIWLFEAKWRNMGATNGT